MAYNYDDLAQSVIDLYRPTLTDNIFDSTPTLQAFRANAGLTEDGGAAIVEPIEIADSSANVGFFSGDANWSINETNLFNQAKYDWGLFRASWTALRDELAKAESSEAKIINLFERRLGNLRQSIAAVLNTTLYTPQSGDAFIGLPDIVSEEDTLGGIDGSSVAPWNAYVDTVGAAATSSNLYSTLVALISGTSYNHNIIDVIWVPEDLFNLYREIAADKVQLDVGDVANLGFKGRSAVVDGVPLAVDRDCTANTAYGLTYKSLSFTRHSSLWMKLGDREAPATNQRLSQTLYSMGQVTCRERRANGKAVFTGVGSEPESED